MTQAVRSLAGPLARVTAAVRLRPARTADAGVLAAILCDWAEATPWMPQPMDRAEATQHLAEAIATMEVTVACPARGRGDRVSGKRAGSKWADGPRASGARAGQRWRPAAPIGFVARRGAFIHALYLAPEARRQGTGSALLAAAQAASPRLTLWVFQANHPARAFYAARGFVAVEAGDGSGNDEGLPDLRLEWRRAWDHALDGVAAQARGAPPGPDPAGWADTGRTGAEARHGPSLMRAGPREAGLPSRPAAAACGPPRARRP